jgi:hypothetical protein
MTRLRSSVVPLLFGLAGTLSDGCSQNPGSNVQCVFESGDVATGRCLTECESRCNLESAAGCAPVDCVKACEKEAAKSTNACADADYARWRCLRTAGLPRVTCGSDGEASFEVPADSCRPELATEEAACVSVDAGHEGEEGR